jgi:hypothetical protein
MDTSIRVEGLTELRAGIRRAGDTGLRDKLKTAHLNAAELVARAALPKVPVRSGRLRSSVKAMGSQTGGRVKAGKASVPYAAAIHWGEGSGNVNFSSGGSVRRKNRNIRGRPFLWEAADQMMGRVTDEYDQQISDLLDQAMRDR